MLSQRIADYIHHRLYEKKDMRAGDILILVRTRNTLYENLIRSLKLKNIPVSGADRLVLTDHIAVMDLMALGAFALLPEDDLNLAACLKSPLIGMGDEDLILLAPERKSSLWEALQARAQEKTDWEKAVAFLKKLLARADRMPPFEFFHAILTEDEGRKKLLARLGPDALDPIEMFLNTALDYEEEAPPSLQGFLYWIAYEEPEKKRDLELRLDRVRITTVHSAKGLEAPVVFLPDTYRVPRGYKRYQPIFLESGDGGARKLPLWSLPKGQVPLPFLAEREKERDEEKMMEEYNRLFYVALTRAKNEIHLCGRQGVHKPQDNNWYHLAAQAWAENMSSSEDADRHQILFDALKKEEVSRATKTHQRAPADLEKEDQSPSKIPAWAQNAYAKEMQEEEILIPSQSFPERLSEEEAMSAPHVSNMSFPEDRLSSPAEEARQRGIHTHRLLQMLPALPPPRWQDAAKKYLAASSLPQKFHQKTEEAVLALLRKPDFAFLLEPHTKREVPLLGFAYQRGEKTLISGQADAIHLPPKGAIRIIDYKVGGKSKKDFASLPPSYIHQMMLYHFVLKERYPKRDVSCAILWTDRLHLQEVGARAIQAALKDAHLRPI